MVLAAVDDLMFSSKIQSALARAGENVTFVRSRDAVLAGIESARPDLVIFDLDRDVLDPLGAIRAVRQHPDPAVRGTRLVAFVRHTSTERIAEARAAGIDLVQARSAFFPALAGLLSDTSRTAFNE